MSKLSNLVIDTYNYYLDYATKHQIDLSFNLENPGYELNQNQFELTNAFLKTEIERLLKIAKPGHKIIILNSSDESGELVGVKTDALELSPEQRKKYRELGFVVQARYGYGATISVRL